MSTPHKLQPLQLGEQASSRQRRQPLQKFPNPVDLHLRAWFSACWFGRNGRRQPSEHLAQQNHKNSSGRLRSLMNRVDYGCSRVRVCRDRNCRGSGRFRNLMRVGSHFTAISRVAPRFPRVMNSRSLTEQKINHARAGRLVKLTRMSQQENRIADSHFSNWGESTAPRRRARYRPARPPRAPAPWRRPAAAIARQLNGPLTALLLYMGEIKQHSHQLSQATGNRDYLQKVVENALQQTERVCAMVKQIARRAERRRAVDRRKAGMAEAGRPTARTRPCAGRHAVARTPARSR